MELQDLLKKGLAIAMILLAVFVAFSTFPKNVLGVALPSLVPIFGVKFAIIFLIFQVGYCYFLDLKKGFFWITGFFIVGSILGALNALMWGGNILRACLVMGACISAGGLSFGALGGKL